MVSFPFYTVLKCDFDSCAAVSVYCQGRRIGGIERERRRRDMRARERGRKRERRDMRARERGRKRERDREREREREREEETGEC